LGYATSTSYGGTSLKPAAFGNRPVHILGGAWAQIRQLLKHSGMNIVSLDFNRIHKLACHGLFVDRTGYEYKLNHVMPSFSTHPLWTCMALSFAAIRTELDEI